VDRGEVHEIVPKVGHSLGNHVRLRERLAPIGAEGFFLLRGREKRASTPEIQAQKTSGYAGMLEAVFIRRRKREGSQMKKLEAELAR